MANTRERTTIKVQAERAVLAAVRLPPVFQDGMGSGTAAPARAREGYDERDPFGELSALAEQAGAVVVGTLEQRRQRPEAGTYMGRGKLDELKALCEMTEATTVIFDHDLSPSQIGKIERIVERKVLDRSELILDIFASRATTHEAKLQVELAQLEYTYPRLRAMWTHLERIAGGGALRGVGTRGPGEQQLEMDRRIVQRKREALRRELETIHARKRRAVRDRKLDYYTVGLVGYTNAGKSTLFNSLTEGGAYADDRLFATLMTRTRQWNLGSSVSVMLSDTVGFVRDLPHHLVASFRSTLEEATHADLLLIVLDVSDPAAELHFQTVMQTLDELDEEVRQREEREAARAGLAPGTATERLGWAGRPKRVLLLNKIDRLPDNREVLIWRRRAMETEGLWEREPIALSARDEWSLAALAEEDAGAGHAAAGHQRLRDVVLRAASGGIEEVRLIVPMRDGKTMQYVENRAEVLERDYVDGEARLLVRIGRRQLDQLRSISPGLRIEGGKGGSGGQAARGWGPPAGDRGEEASESGTGVENRAPRADTHSPTRHPSSVGRAELS